MRKLYALLLVLALLAVALLIAYAFIPQAKAWMDKTIAPPIHGVFGGVATTVTGSHIWQTYVTPPLNAFIIGMFAMIPIAWLWHKSFNRVRQVFVRSAAKDSGMYPTMTEPISSTTVQPQPIATTEKKEEPAQA